MLRTVQLLSQHCTQHLLCAAATPKRGEVERGPIACPARALSGGPPGSRRLPKGMSPQPPEHTPSGTLPQDD